VETAIDVNIDGFLSPAQNFNRQYLRTGKW